MKIKNIIIYLVVGIIVISSFKIPEVILKMEETALENNIYQKKSKKAINDINLDIDAEKVYLVKALHDLQIINEVTISSSTKVE